MVLRWIYSLFLILIIVSLMANDKSKEQLKNMTNTAATTKYDLLQNSKTESLALEIKRLNRLVDNWNTAYIWGLVFAVILGAFTGLSQYKSISWAKRLVSTEEQMQSEKDRLFTADLVEKDLKIRAADTVASDARGRAARAELTTEQEKIARLKLEKQMEPRRLTESQKLEIIELLSKFPPFKVQFDDPSMNDTKEVFDFMDDLKDVFIRMKLIERGTPSGKGKINLSVTSAKGVILGSKNHDEKPAALVPFGNLLIHMGFATTWEGAPLRHVDANTMLVLVGPKQ